MTYALVNDIPITWPTYETIAADVLAEAPPGLVVHVAGPTDEGVRVIDVWVTEEAFRAFERDRLGPTLSRHRPPGLPPPLFRDLGVRHLLVGRADA